MATFSFDIPLAKVAEYVDDYCYIHGNTELNDPNDPSSGLKYTDAQWVKEHIVRGVRATVRRGKDMKYNDAKVTVNVDDIV